MKKNFVFAPLAVVGLLLGTTALHAQATDTRSVSASVSGALQGDTGFLTGGQVQVTGVGQGGVTLTRNNAAINVIAGSSASIPADTNPGTVGIPTSGSSMVTTFDFNRDVNTSGALVGIAVKTTMTEAHTVYQPWLLVIMLLIFTLISIVNIVRVMNEKAERALSGDDS